MSASNRSASAVESRSEPSRPRSQTALSQTTGPVRQSLAALREQGHIFKSVLDCMAEGVIVVDLQGSVLLCNPAAERILGRGLHGVPPADWPHEFGVYLPDRETFCPVDQFPLTRVIRGDPAEPCKLFVKNDARPKGIWVSVDGRPLQDDRGTLQGGIAVIRDITEQEQARDIVAQQERELKRSNRDLEQFAYASSHDLQEPLRAVSGYCQLLARRYAGQLEPKAVEYITEAVNGVRRMQSLIEGLLAYSRVGRQGNPIVATDSQAALDRALTNLRESIAECDAEISHTQLPTVAADPLQLAQLFQNLIGNALKYRGDLRPCIHVAAVLRRKRWLFSVRDNGIGIEPQYAKRIFVIFQRLHTRAEYPGTGIGLALCKRIVERHGGSIWVESAPGEGSSFCFTLAQAPRTGNAREGNSREDASREGNSREDEHGDRN